MLSTVLNATVSRSYSSFAENAAEDRADEAMDQWTSQTPNHPNHWGILLAGGDGTRMQGLTHLITGDDRPKQFCAVMGKETLLQQASRRASRTIAPERTIVALTRAHARYYSRDLRNTRLTRLVQPCNRGTAPAIILSLLHISRLDPAALVAILPSDHYYSNENIFCESLQRAFEIAEARSSSVVLLGARAETPETEFGWIELGTSLDRGLSLVRSFHEKPCLQDALRLLRNGALWSTLVAVAKVQTLIETAFASVPNLVVSLFDVLPRANSDAILRIPRSSYESLAVTDFSRAVLTKSSHRLLALRLGPVEWHDLGQPERVVEIVRSRAPEPPAWVYAWERATLPSRKAFAV